MMKQGPQLLCRFYLTNYVRWAQQPLYEAIIDAARREKMAGATAFRGMMGFAKGRNFLKERPVVVANELPMIVELVDTPQKISSFLKNVEPIISRCMVSLEQSDVICYRSDPEPDPSVGDQPREPFDYRMMLEYHQRNFKVMKTSTVGTLLRVFIGESEKDSTTGKPLYEAIVRKAQSHPIAGASVFRGHIGYGKHAHYDSPDHLDLSSDVPVVVEMVDSEENISSFLDTVEEMVKKGLVTMERVRVVQYLMEPEE
ncbi:MAG: DUF190 domain-containing protein [bacterium]